MEIIAKTDNGVLISATKKEVGEILRAVQGKLPETLENGQKIPAIDYAGTITRIKHLSESYEYTSLINKIEELSNYINELDKCVKSAADI